jgi:hypothetical protein
MLRFREIALQWTKIQQSSLLKYSLSRKTYAS